MRADCKRAPVSATMTTMSQPKFVFFGGEPLGMPALEALKAAQLLPTLIVANPDRPVGRKQVLTPPPVKTWADKHGIPTLQPESYKDRAALAPLTETSFDLFVVVAYNHILPQWLIELPQHQTINLHPSLLPKWRGASPIRSAILADERVTGVTIMLLDTKMDHGPILSQEVIEIPASDWPMAGPKLDTKLAEHGAALLAATISEWVAGTIEPQEQDHEAATYCGKITKDMAELPFDPFNLPQGEAAHQTLLKIQAYAGWPVAFFIHEGKRYKITAAHRAADGRLVIDSVIPEGKKEMSFTSVFS